MVFETLGGWDLETVKTVHRWADIQATYHDRHAGDIFRQLAQRVSTRIQRGNAAMLLSRMRPHESDPDVDIPEDFVLEMELEEGFTF